MSSDSEAEVVKWLVADRALSYMYVAFATCVIYDHISTLDAEIELVWKRRRWSVVQVLFLINRYVGDGFQIYTTFIMIRHIVMKTDQGCNFLSVFHGYLVPVILWSMQGIMMYRISSMYDHTRKIMGLLGGTFFIEVFFVILIPCLSYSVKAPVSDPAPGVHLCTRDSFPHFLFALWIPILLFESVLLSLSLFIGIRYYRTLWSSAISQSQTRKFQDSLLYVLVRDSIAFPFMAVIVCLANLIVWIRLSILYTQMAFALAAFIPCILGARLILNLQEAYYEPFSREVDVNARRAPGPGNPRIRPSDIDLTVVK